MTATSESAAEARSSMAPGLWLPFVFVPLVAWFKDATVVALAVGAIMVIGSPRLRAGVLRNPRPSPTMLSGGAFLTWSLIAVAWAPAHDPVGWAKAFGAIVLAIIVGRGIAAMTPAQAEQTGTALVVSAFALYALLTVERFTGGALIGLVRAGESRDRLFDILSPGLVVLSALAIPVAVVIQRRTGSGLVGTAFVAACFMLALSYRMDAAPAALTAAIVAFGIVRALGRRGFLLVAAGLALIALAWGEAAALAARHGLDAWFTAEANLNWGYRIDIWTRVHTLIAERFWLGHGFDSARHLAQAPAEGATFLHPHNGLLQVWVELGAVGVVLFLAWAAAAALHAYRKSDRLAAIAATVTALAVFWSVSFGIWQGWWVSTIGIGLCAVRLLERLTPLPSRTAA